tara:strand:+ start:2098 stop:5670 length:3573 start_codon:yes stop_codon:yes gene_type:complete
MENYSIFGSNITNEYLLKLQNNENNIKIDIHNIDHNFTINYLNSNQHENIYNSLGLKDITKIDENNYIHKIINNNSNVVITGTYGLDADNPTTKYFANFNENISEELQSTIRSSDYMFNNYDGLYDSYYHKYSSTNLVSNNELLRNYKFYDNDLQLIQVLSGVFIYIKFNERHNITKYNFFNYDDTNLVFPHKVKFYQIFDKNAYLINQQIFRNKSDFNLEYINNNDSYVSDAVLIQIESVLISDVNLTSEINLLYNKDSRTTDYVEEIDADTNVKSNYKLNVAFNGIKLYTTNKRLVNEYDIDMNNNNIQNINTLSTTKLILNNVIYDNVVSSDTILATVNKVISDDLLVKIVIVEDYFEHIAIKSTNIQETYNPEVIRSISSNIRINEDKKYIPYVYLNNDDNFITVEYDSNVNIKYLLNLSDLNNTDLLLKHSNGIIYKENKVDNLEITDDLVVLNDINVSNNIIINSNILSWDNNIDKFRHKNGKIIQDHIFDVLSYEPVINKVGIKSFDESKDAFTLTYSNNDRLYYIRHPFNFVIADTHTTESISALYINSFYNIIDLELDSYNCNIPIQFLDLVNNLNIYISSRFGNVFNNTQDSGRIQIKNSALDIELTRTDHRLTYLSNNVSVPYVDYYEYEFPENVVLKQLSFYDIDFEEYERMYNNYLVSILNSYNSTDLLFQLENQEKYYRYTDKQELITFDIIGYDNNNWELIQSVDNLISLIKYKEVKIKSSKKYLRYRIVIKDNDNINPYIIKDLRFHVEYEKENKNILYNGDNINFNIVNTLSINNSIRWNEYFKTDHNIRTKLIINEDNPKINEGYTINTNGNIIPYAVCHINDKIDNLGENHLLKLGLSGVDNTPSVYHSLHLLNNNLYYTQSVINNFNTIQNSDNHNEFLIMVENNYENRNLKGLVSINVSKEYLSNIINDADNKISDINGLIVNPSLRLCAFENGLKSYMDISLDDSLTLDNSYKIVLPNNSCNINSDETYYLKPIADHINKTLKTEWVPLGGEVFTKPNIYVGRSESDSIFDNLSGSFSNFDINNNIYTEEYLTHIRKLVIGYPSYFSDYNKINNNVLTIGGSVYATHDVSTDSDISYKYNFEKIEDVRNKIEQLNGYTFERNDTNENRRYCGLIAQEIEKVIPEVIIKKHDGKLRVLYNNLAGLFVECFKDLYNEIDELKKAVGNHKV